ncbi:RIP metalloprotease RseP [Desulfoferrobacter suflitae]|uniref:RIP metalloprotease RseP n=1 Tax=Desulfoferrobacter suflitae TaxID=2865782 RepID=UPI00216464C5|nr:RIP metalloprotease RseP [Desulfoferrobacter suflitae]MCK8600674.1 RIP metalloprotease RseP [Desulfoferrobacter suflitae]
MLTTIIATVVVLGILIFVHELGHFLVAKWAGVRVLRFSLGFGPRIVSVTRGETEYCISAVPLGGYVKMLGEDAEEEVPEQDKERSFPAQSVWKRIGIVLAGPSSNLLFAIIIFALVYAVAGIPQMTTEIGSVNPASPAEQAGLRSGDLVLTINGESVSQWDQLSNMIQEHGEQPLVMEIQRGEEVKVITVTPQSREIKNIFGESIKRPVIGISAAGKFNVKRVNPLLAGYYSLAQTWNLSKLFLLTVVKLIERVVPLQTLGGPLLIAQMTGQQAQEGILNLIYFTALISINLGILNLLPIPVLDGGHLFFFFIEAILGRPIDMKKIEMAQRIGMVFLIVLMIFVFYNDIMRLITGQPSPAP